MSARLFQTYFEKPLSRNFSGFLAPTENVMYCTPRHIYNFQCIIGKLGFQVSSSPLDHWTMKKHYFSVSKVEKQTSTISTRKVKGHGFWPFLKGSIKKYTKKMNWGGIIRWFPSICGDECKDIAWGYLRTQADRVVNLYLPQFSWISDKNPCRKC